MPWQTMDVEEQKARFVVAATRQEKSFTALRQESGIPRPTGCLWGEALSRSGLGRDRRAQPASAAESHANHGGVGAVRGSDAPTLSRLGSA
jgi:hypothetical protein